MVLLVFALAALGLPAQELLVLPATCRVVKNLRVQELGSSAQA